MRRWCELISRVKGADMLISAETKGRARKFLKKWSHLDIQHLTPLGCERESSIATGMEY